MLRSLRWRLLLWNAGLLLLVVVSFGALLFLRVQAARFHEVDRQLSAAAHTLEAALRTSPLHGPLPELRLPEELQGHPGRREDRMYFAIWRADGSPLKFVDLPYPAHADDFDPRHSDQPHHFSTWHDFREVWLRGPQGTTMLVGKDIRRERADLAALALQIVGVGLAVIAGGLAGGYAITAQIVRPIAAIAKTASTISASNLSHRIETGGLDTELVALADFLNAMFARLEAAFNRQQQFTADASHELRTPLAILRSNAELALARSRTPEEYQRTIETCLQAAERMGAIIQGLLTLARLDAGNRGASRHVVDLKNVVRAAIDLLQPLADERRITLTSALATVHVAGDGEQLERVVLNLLANAIKYNKPLGQVHLKIEATPQTATIVVADTGVGIPDKLQPQIFERFFRVDKARSRMTGGNGLGLAICKAIVEAHDGTIDFVSKLGEGSTFRVYLPRRTVA